MNKTLISCLMLVGCAHVSFTDPRPDDVECGTVAHIKVVNRHHSILSCYNAVGWVKETYITTQLTGEWTVYFTGAFAGFDVDKDLNAYTPDGVTYPGARAMVVRSVHPWVLEHEFAHAADFDARGRSDRE